MTNRERISPRGTYSTEKLTQKLELHLGHVVRLPYELGIAQFHVLDAGADELRRCGITQERLEKLVRRISSDQRRY